MTQQFNPQSFTIITPLIGSAYIAFKNAKGKWQRCRTPKQLLFALASYAETVTSFLDKEPNHAKPPH